ncbi:MAG TPA: oligosaccharide flippase family protein [Streptosporangiaceae bacterium]|nr:oligosaccharide flippase family protein [Streptosporangiaceae bacterium]
MTQATLTLETTPGQPATQEPPAPASPAPAGRPISRRANVVKLALVAAIWAMPLLVPSGPGNTAPADLFLGVFILASALWFASRARVMRLPYMLPVGLSILAGALASTVAYRNAYVSVGGGLISLIQDAFVLAWCIGIANVGRDPAMLRTASRAWAISAVTWAALMILGVMAHIGVLSGENARNGVRAAFTLGDPNLAANYFICSLLVLRAARFPRRRVIRWICCALLVAAIALTGSNGGALVLTATTVLGAIFGMARRRGAVPAIITASALAFSALLIAPHVHVQSIVARAQSSSQFLHDSIGRQAESAGSRSTILSQTEQLYLTADGPLGIGPGGTKAAFQEHQYSYVKMAHDDYAASLVERGLLGAVALVFLLVIVGARARRIAGRGLRPDYARIFPRPELLGTAVIGMFISAMFYQVLHFRHVWALLGLVAAADLWGRRDAGGGRPGTPEAGRRPMRPPGSGRGLGARRGEAAARLDDPAGPAPEVPPRAPPPAPPSAKGISARLTKLVPAVLTANVAARVVALACLTVATVLVARAGGPKLLGELTLLRVLPGLAGVLVGCGLPSAAPFFLAGQNRDKPRLRTTILVLTLAGSLAASGCWLALSPFIHRVFFHSWHIGVVLAAAVPVFSQLWVATGKAFLQGENDMRGANWAIAAEEAAFLPVYVALLPVLHGTSLLMTALVGADVLVTGGIVVRLAMRGYLRHWGRLDLRLAREICGYGIRGQVGGMLSLINLRLDVAILGALVGPGTLGVYAVASKYAELLRLPGLAVTYVLYPRLTARDRQDAARDVAALLPRALVLTALAAIPLAAAVPLLPDVYGHAFASATIPAYILLFGLVGEGVAGLVSAYLYAVGRPGANSLALGVSVVVTIALDVTLIPHYHAVGAAVASAVAYLTSSAALVVCYLAVRKLTHQPRPSAIAVRM